MFKILIILIYSCRYIGLEYKMNDIPRNINKLDRDLKDVKIILKKAIEENDVKSFKNTVEKFNLQNDIDSIVTRIKIKTQYYRVESIDINPMNMLMYASYKLSFDVIEYLLTLKVDVNKVYEGLGYKSAYMYFLYSSKKINSINIKILKLFLDKGADCNKNNSNEALCIAIDLDDVLSLDTLVNHFSDRGDLLMCMYKRSPLAYACMQGSIKCIQFLIDHKHSIDDGKKSCLNDCMNKFDSFKLLLANGADPKKINIKGLRNLSLNKNKEDSISILKHLLPLRKELYTEFLSKDPLEKNIFIYTAESGNVDMFELYLEDSLAESNETRMDKINSKDKYEKNTLMYAAQDQGKGHGNTFVFIPKDNSSMIVYLLNQGADPNQRDKSSSYGTLPRTALQFIKRDEDLENILPIFLENDKYNFSDCTYIFKRFNGKNKDTLLLYMDAMKKFYNKYRDYKEALASIKYIHPVSRFKNPEVKDAYIDVIKSIIISLNEYKESYTLSKIVEYKDIICHISEFFNSNKTVQYSKRAFAKKLLK